MDHITGADDCGHTNLGAGGPGSIDDLNMAAAVVVETEKTALNITTKLAVETRELSILMEIRSTLSNEEVSFRWVRRMA